MGWLSSVDNSCLRLFTWLQLVVKSPDGFFTHMWYLDWMVSMAGFQSDIPLHLASAMAGLGFLTTWQAWGNQLL